MKFIYLLFCVFLFLAISKAQSNPVVYSVLYSNGQYSVIEGYSEYSVAMASHDAEQDKTGWNHLKISIVKSNPNSSQIKMKAAGFLEGYITQNEIFNSYYNFANGTGDPTTPQMRTFIEENDNWLRQNAFAQNPNTYWNTISLLISQYDGIIAGYQAAAPQGQNLTRYQLMVYALQFELGDIAIATSLRKSHLHASFHDEFYPHFIEKFARDHPFFKTNRGQTKIKGDLMGEHCSSCVKLTDGAAKLMSSHDTWSMYNTMLREYKHYDLETGKVQFSSYPGLPYSGDDFYINNNKLVIMETTNSIFNNSLYTATTTKTVPYWLRVQVASYLATTGPMWHSYFSMYNNGGYNNQWIIIDYKLFTPGKTLPPFVLTIGEQVPGYYVYDDQTSFLNQNGYWASYNIPFYPFIYNISGYPAMYQKYGNAYSWSMCARAQIYRRDQHKAQNFTLFHDLQRYNHWQVDPLSLEDSCRGISARCDLNFPWNNNTLNGYAAFGAIDSKSTDETLVGSMVSYAVAGPSWTSQPIFWWSDSWKYVPHQGLTPVYAFDFIKMK